MRAGPLSCPRLLLSLIGRLPISDRTVKGRDTPDMTERIEVERAVAAEPTEIFRVVSDPNGHVAIDASGMLMDATGEPATKVGDTFTIHMDRDALNDYPLGLYDVTCTIVTFEQDREIAWTPGG